MLAKKITEDFLKKYPAKSALYKDFLKRMFLKYKRAFEQCLEKKQYKGDEEKESVKKMLFNCKQELKRFGWDEK